MQYQVSPATAPAAKQNGETPTTKTTAIHISSGPPDTALSSNTNSNNSNTTESTSSQGLPPSVVKFLVGMPPPLQAPVGPEVAHTGQDALEWQRRRAWRVQNEREPGRDVDTVDICNVAADKQSKPTSDTS